MRVRLYENDEEREVDEDIGDLMIRRGEARMVRAGLPARRDRVAIAAESEPEEAVIGEPPAEVPARSPKKGR